MNKGSPDLFDDFRGQKLIFLAILATIDQFSNRSGDPILLYFSWCKLIWIKALESGQPITAYGGMLNKFYNCEGYYEYVKIKIIEKFTIWKAKVNRRTWKALCTFLASTTILSCGQIGEFYSPKIWNFENLGPKKSPDREF